MGNPDGRGPKLIARCAGGALALCALCAHADAPTWLPVRDQNPFVLGAGLPLLPQSLLHAGDLTLDVDIAESNSQLISSGSGLSVVYGAETRESRFSLAYALSDSWTLRASLGDFWVGVGFLDKPIQHFHQLIGAPHGYRGGRLGVRPPYISVGDGTNTLYLLDRPGEDIAPLLLDLTRSWSPAPGEEFGLTLGAKLPVGSTHSLSDTGSTGVSVAAFADFTVFDATQLGARIGYLHQNGSDVLPTLVRNGVPFADVYASTPLIGQWRAELQYDVHGALYRNVPNFLNYGGILSGGLVHPLGARGKLTLSVSEDMPIAHTQDVVLEAAFEYEFGR